MKTIANARQFLTTPNLTLAAMLSICGAFLILGATSCSTAHGFGRDVEKTGEKIQNAAH